MIGEGLYFGDPLPFGVARAHLRRIGASRLASGRPVVNP